MNEILNGDLVFYLELSIPQLNIRIRIRIRLRLYKTKYNYAYIKLQLLRRKPSYKLNLEFLEFTH